MASNQEYFESLIEVKLPDNRRGPIFKSNRAYDHLSLLENEIAAWFDGGKHASFALGLDPDAPADLVLRGSADDLPIAPFSLLIGDIVHSLRSSLDYIAYELALFAAKTLTDEQARISQFPIIGDRNLKGVSGTGPSRFVNARLKDLCCVDSKAQDFIESVQPYQLGPKFERHPLWALQELSNTDKHRHLQVTACTLKEARILNVNATEDSGMQLTMPGHIKQNTILLRLLGAAIENPEYETSVSFEPPELTISFIDGPRKDGHVTAVLWEIHEYVTTKVLVPLSEFLV